MKTTQSSENDKPLHELLAQWKPESRLPPRFQDKVWKRTERVEALKPQSALVAFAPWLEAAFRRPALATAYVAVLMFVGLGAGYLQAQDKTVQTDSKMRALYVQSVDPYQAPRN